MIFRIAWPILAGLFLVLAACALVLDALLIAQAVQR